MKRRSKQFRRERIPVDEARILYDRLRNWRLVAEHLRRRNGSKFDTWSISKAVRWSDLGNAGTR